MMVIRKAKDRGYADHGWLKSFHTFSFANFYDPRQMGFRTLRVINEDRIDGGTGFPTHPHRDMEILSYVIEGALEHADTLGNKTVIRKNEIQRMTAGRGIAHSEFNHSKSETGHFLQIWIEPNRQGLDPGYDQKDFGKLLDAGDPVLLASATARAGSVLIHQDVELWAQRLAGGAQSEYSILPKRHVWIQMISGQIEAGSPSPIEISAGDGLAISGESEIKIKTGAGAEFLLFDLS